MFITVAVILSCIYKYDSSSIIIIVHSFIAVLVIIFTNPIGAHAIARGARRSGIKPYGAVRDDMDEIVPKRYRETEEN
jgi:multicomponent Na+:H+ antiporter subunit G